MRIDSMPVMQPYIARLSQPSSSTSVYPRDSRRRPTAQPLPRRPPASSSPIVAPKPQRPHGGAVRWAITWFVIFVSAIAWLDSLAPRDFHHPVSPSSVGSAPITGDPCAGFGGVASATAVNDSGPATLVQVICGDGVRTLVAR